MYGTVALKNRLCVEAADGALCWSGMVPSVFFGGRVRSLPSLSAPAIWAAGQLRMGQLRPVQLKIGYADVRTIRAAPAQIAFRGRRVTTTEAQTGPRERGFFLGQILGRALARDPKSPEISAFLIDLGDPYGNRTRVSAVKGPRPDR